MAGASLTSTNTRLTTVVGRAVHLRPYESETHAFSHVGSSAARRSALAAGPDQRTQSGLEHVKLLPSQLRRPTGAHVVEHLAANPHHFVSASGDNELLPTAVRRVGLTLDIAELFERGDRLSCRLPRDPKVATQLGRVLGASVYGLKRELMTRSHPRMTSPFKLCDDLIDHRIETTEQKHCQLSATRRVHVSTLTVRVQFDNVVVVAPK
jgi:hypothetical protein